MWLLKVKVTSWPWPQDIYIWKLKLVFLKNHWPIFNQIFVCKLAGTRKWKFDDMMPVTWPRWPPRPYMVKNLLQNGWMDFNKTWYVALGTPAHYSLFKWWPWVDLDLIYGWVKFGKLGFSIGKNWKLWIFQKLLKPVTLKLLDADNLLIELIKVWKVKVIFLTLAPGYLHVKIKTWFS